MNLASVEPYYGGERLDVEHVAHLWAGCQIAAREIMSIRATTANYCKVKGAWLPQQGAGSRHRRVEPVKMADASLRPSLGDGVPGMNTAWASCSYLALDATKRDEFDRDHGIEPRCRPEVRGGVRGRRAPGLRSDRDDRSGFACFRWAGVIMTSGPTT